MPSFSLFFPLLFHCLTSLASLSLTGRSSGKKYDFTRIKAAFETYKRIHGDLLVQAKYVVPVNDDAWPRETWGIKLGTYTQLVRVVDVLCSLSTM